MLSQLLGGIVLEPRWSFSRSLWPPPPVSSNCTKWAIRLSVMLQNPLITLIPNYTSFAANAIKWGACCLWHSKKKKQPSDKKNNKKKNSLTLHWMWAAVVLVFSSCSTRKISPRKLPWAAERRFSRSSSNLLSSILKWFCCVVSFVLENVLRTVQNCTFFLSGIKDYHVDKMLYSKKNVTFICGLPLVPPNQVSPERLPVPAAAPPGP